MKNKMSTVLTLNVDGKDRNVTELDENKTM